MEDARLGSIQMIGALQVMLEVVGRFGLYYSEQTQGILRSLVATLSLLSRVIESQGEDTEILFIRDRLQQVTRAGPFTQMVVFGTRDRWWFLSW